MTRALITLKIDQVVSGLVVGDFSNTSFFRLRLTERKKKQVTKSPDPLLDDISYIIYGSTVLTWSGGKHTQQIFSERQVNIYVKNLMICTFWLSLEMLQKLI